MPGQFINLCSMGWLGCHDREKLLGVDDENMPHPLALVQIQGMQRINSKQAFDSELQKLNPCEWTHILRLCMFECILLLPAHAQQTGRYGRQRASIETPMHSSQE